MLDRLRACARDGKDDQGFTLIELLVVIIIIGILSAIAVPVFMSQRKKGVDASVKSDLRALAQQIESYYLDYGGYPGSITQSVGVITMPPSTTSFYLSPGNAVSYTPNATYDAYCLQGTNANGSKNWVYMSNRGGIQLVGANQTTCPAAGAF